jgi:nucleoside-triphosphatase
MAQTVRQNILLTGRPGIGKTTVIAALAERLAAAGIVGFYTEEIRERGTRRGFRVETFGGQTGSLALVGFKSSARVGRYGVDVAAFEGLVVPELARPGDVVLIDEIGKMECFSARFIAAVRQLLDGPTPVVATVAAKGAGFIAEVKARFDVEVIEVTTANRDELPARLAERYRTS